MKKDELRYKIRRITLILSLIMGILLVLVFQFNNMFSPEINKILLLMLGALFIAMMLLIVVFNVLSDSIINRLALLPIGYGVFIATYIFYNTGVHKMLMQSIGIATELNSTESITDLMFNFFPKAMNGIWLSAAPLIIYIIYRYLKINKNLGTDTGNFNNHKGTIHDLQITNLIIDNHRVYDVHVNMLNPNGQYDIVKKSCIILPHLLHLISVGQEVNLLVDPNDYRNFRIQTSQGIIG